MPTTNKVILAIVMVTVGIVPTHSYSQDHLGNCDANPRVNLQDLNLDILLGLTMTDDSQAKFEVSFLNNGTDTPHKHIDYAFTISDQDGKQIFNASPSNQPTLHTAEGVVTIPYTIQQKGDYSVDVIVYGVDFTPTIPHVTTFPCKDIPEFPIGMLAGVAAAMTAAIVISRMYKLRI
ncbi:MAG: hypothetical protein ACREAZ_01120 [Nitrososphaera sp.]